MPNLGKSIRKIRRGASKVRKRGKRDAKIFKAGVKLLKMSTDPKSIATVGKRYSQGKGVVLPGHKYIGPGNPLDAGEPTNAADHAARLHDNDYDRLLEAGVSPKKLYLGYSDADQRLMDRSDVTTAGGLATYLGMGVKKKGWQMGLTGHKIKDSDYGVIPTREDEF